MQLYCMDLSMGEPERIYVTSSYIVTHDGKNYYHDFVTYLELLMDFSSLGEVNLKGYVTCSYNDFYNVRHARRENNFDDFS